MKNLIKILIASALILGYTAVAAGGSAFGGGSPTAAKLPTSIMAGVGGSAFGGG